MFRHMTLGLTVCFSMLQATGIFAAFIPPFPASGVILSGKALYFQTNEASNAVVSVAINDNGTLGDAHLTYTNGSGASMISATTNMTAAPDGLSSQGSVFVVGHSLFVVNAGDNTVSLFNIDEIDPTNITLVGSPAAVPGDFPVTVAASDSNKLVCVGTSGTRSGVSCAPYSPFVGIGEMDFLRRFDLNQSEIPRGPLNTVSQVLFSEDESQLVVTVKGDPSQNKTGFLAAFSVSGPCLTGEARVSASRIDSTLNGTVALFGFQQIAQSNRYFVADPGYGAAIISIDGKTENSQLLHKQIIPDQKATCWAAISPVSGSAFVTDPLVNHVVELSLVDASIVSTINTTSSNDASGYIDLVASGKFIYLLSPGEKEGSGSEIAVLSFSEGKNRSIVQSFSLGSLAGSSAQGMAVFPKF